MGSTSVPPSKNPISSLPSEFISQQGIITKESIINYKLIAFYFSAHWCPPCRAFTPKLAEFYKKVNDKEKILQIIFVSSDNDLTSFNNYFSTMPWIAIPFANKKREEIMNIFGIYGIPCLIVCDNLGNIVDSNGRNSVNSEGIKVVANWLKNNI